MTKDKESRRKRLEKKQQDKELPQYRRKQSKPYKRSRSEQWN